MRLAFFFKGRGNMADGINAIPALMAGAAWAGHAAAPAAPAFRSGDILRLTVVETGADGVKVMTEDGQALLLPGLGDRPVLPGEALSWRILATTPRLLLAPLEAEAAVRPDGVRPTDVPVWHGADPLQLQRIGWAAPDAARLASAWRVLVLSRMAAQLESATLATGQRIPAWLLQADPGLALQRDVAPSAGEARWMFPAFAWGGLPVTLRVDDNADDEAAGGRDAVPGGALSVMLSLPGIGLLVLRLRLHKQGVLIALVVENEQARRLVRARAIDIVRAVKQAGGSLLQCLVSVGNQVEAAGRRRQAMRQPLRLPPPQLLFDLAAHILVALARPTAAGAPCGD